MINIPYDFNGQVEYQKYNDIEKRIRNFPNYKVIGRDESGLYNMYSILIGDKNKPCLFLGSGLHGTEFHAISYHLSFLESLRDNTFPDKELRNRLLNEFCILSIPVMNPYGVDNNNDIYLQFNNPARLNANGIDLNSDFYNQTQLETKNIIKELTNYEIFSGIDMHLFQIDYNVNTMIIAGSQKETEKYRDEWVESQEKYTGKKMTVWINPDNPNKTSGLLRRFISFRDNQYTPHTLSYITEFVRPTRKNGVIQKPLSEREIFKFGCASLYLFFKTSLKYFDDNKNIEQNDSEEVIYKIVTPIKTIFIKRENGVATEIEEHYNEENGGKKIRSKIIRDNLGRVDKIERVFM